MQYIGIDIIETARIKGAVARWGDSFLSRIYTVRELEKYRKKPSSLAARFAGKEAVIKVLGLRSKGIGLKEIEILADAEGKPTVSLYGRAQSQANELGLSSLAVSLSHCRQYAVACAAGQSAS